MLLKYEFIVFYEFYTKNFIDFIVFIRLGM